MSEAVRPGQTFAGYRIEEVAGRGAMGVVYRATDVGRHNTVALKLIAPELAADQAFRKRFRRECRLLSSLDHPTVITVYKAGEADGQPFISMRYVEGTELQSLIAGGGRLTPERAARIVAQVADGLDAAHMNGLVHRDVKPANVLIERRDGAEHAYLDARSDVYALGCVLFQTLTGRVAYTRDSDAAKLHAHLNLAAPSARALRPKLPAELGEVIARAMASDGTAWVVGEKDLIRIKFPPR